MTTATELAHKHSFVPAGGTVHDLIVSALTTTEEGIAAEYEHVERVCGRRKIDWTFERQMVTREPDSRRYDLLRLRMKDGTIHVFVFDITSFFGTHNNQHELNNGPERS